MLAKTPKTAKAETKTKKVEPASALPTAPKKKTNRQRREMAAAMGADTWVREFCTKAELSRILKLSMRALSDLDAKGELIRGGKTGTYRTLPTIHAYIERLRLTAAGRLGQEENPLAKEKLATQTLERRMAALKLAQLEGKVLLVDEVSESWSAFALKVKTTLLTVPTRVRGKLPHLSSHDQEQIRLVVTDMLKQLSKDVDESVIGAEGKDVRP